MEQVTNDLVDFMQSLTREMGDEYNRIAKRSIEDPGTAGDEGEENWAKIFRDWLPADYHVVTRGRLLGDNGVAGPQVDVIILHPFYPKALLNKKLYLTAGVIAAFECKNTLKAAHIEEAVLNSIAIRELYPSKAGDCIDEMFSPVIYGLLSHSHSWKSQGSNPKQTISNKLAEADNQHIKRPKDLLDFICVSDLAIWSSFKQPMSMSLYEKDSVLLYNYVHGVQTGYGFSHKEFFPVDSTPYRDFTPIGTLLSRLITKLAVFDTRLKELGLYFNQAGISGAARIEYRNWPVETLTDEARYKLDVMSMEAKRVLFSKLF